MSGSVKWSDIRAESVELAGGEQAFAAGKEQMLAEARGQQLAGLRRKRCMTQQQVAERMGATKGRVSQIEQGEASGQEVIARYARALGGQLHQAIYFDGGDIAAISRPGCRPDGRPAGYTSNPRLQPRYA